MSYKVIVCYNDENEYRTFKTSKGAETFFNKQVEKCIIKDYFIGCSMIKSAHKEWVIKRYFATPDNEAIVKSTTESYIKELNRIESER